MRRHERELELPEPRACDRGRHLAPDFQDRRAELKQTERHARTAEDPASVATLVTDLAHETATAMGVIQRQAEPLESLQVTSGGAGVCARSGRPRAFPQTRVGCRWCRVRMRMVTIRGRISS
jgi:hypothetical protein